MSCRKVHDNLMKENKVVYEGLVRACMETRKGCPPKKELKNLKDGKLVCGVKLPGTEECCTHTSSGHPWPGTKTFAELAGLVGPDGAFME